MNYWRQCEFVEDSRLVLQNYTVNVFEQWLSKTAQGRKVQALSKALLFDELWIRIITFWKLERSLMSDLGLHFALSDHGIFLFQMQLRVFLSTICILIKFVGVINCHFSRIIGTNCSQDVCRISTRGKISKHPKQRFFFHGHTFLTRSSPSTIYSTPLATDIVPRLFTLESIGLVYSFPKT